MKIPSVKIQTEYTPFAGGLDLISSPLSVSPGMCLACLNYETGTLGGYNRIDGFERFDGQPSPSEQTYEWLNVTFTGDVVSGDIITGDISGATGQVVTVGDNYLTVTKTTGTFQIESFKVNGVIKGDIVSKVADGTVIVKEHAEIKKAVADIYRADISAPPGTGKIEGIFVLKGVVYCVKDGVFYKATTSGWIEIPYYSEISFVSGQDPIPDGTSITQVTSGATAVVKRTVLESGAWGADAAGRLILSDITGTFNDSDAIQVSGTTFVTASSTVSQISVIPGGRYETVIYNFYSQLETQRIYGCDGVNYGFEFDGDVYVPLHTGMSDDAPTHVSAWKLQLFFSFKSSLQNSGVGTPYEWTAISGSLEIGSGDNITAIHPLTGDALGIFGRNSSYQLIGNNVDDFNLSLISQETGAVPYTCQAMKGLICVDDRGIISVDSTNKYGNFAHDTLSEVIHPLISEYKNKIVASTIYKEKNQIRFYCNDGYGLIVSFLNRGLGFSRFQYPVNVTCVVSSEDLDGHEIIFFGTDDGMVYQAGKGTSFDGEEIEAYFLTHFNSSRSPNTVKTYRKAVFNVSINEYSKIRFSPEFSFADYLISQHVSDYNIAQHVSDTEALIGNGGYWDLAFWEEFIWSSPVVASPSMQLTGTGKNIAFMIYSKSDIDQGHTIHGVSMNYTPRRMEL